MALTATQMVRTLANDYFPADTSQQVFSDDEIDGFYALEGNSVKRAAAQAIDTIADNEALVSKVIKTQGGITTDGAKVADALRKRAATLRQQADQDLALGDDGSSSTFIPAGRSRVPELTEHPSCDWGFW